MLFFLLWIFVCRKISCKSGQRVRTCVEKQKSICDTLFVPKCLRKAARTLVMFSAIMTNRGNDCAHVCRVVVAPHMTQIQRRGKREVKLLRWTGEFQGRVSVISRSLYQPNPGLNPPSLTPPPPHPSGLGRSASSRRKSSV